MFENYFDMPCAIICSRIVDILDKKVRFSIKQINIFPELFSSFCFIIRELDYQYDYQRIQVF